MYSEIAPSPWQTLHSRVICTGLPPRVHSSHRVPWPRHRGHRSSLRCLFVACVLIIFHLINGLPKTNCSAIFLVINTHLLLGDQNHADLAQRPRSRLITKPLATGPNELVQAKCVLANKDLDALVKHGPFNSLPFNDFAPIHRYQARDDARCILSLRHCWPAPMYRMAPADCVSSPD